MQSNLRKTKIIITLGRASSSLEVLVNLLHEGIDAVRITTRFLNSDERTKVLENLREAERITGRYVCVILSLREGDIRIGNANAGTQLNLTTGDEIKIVPKKYNKDEPNTIVCNNSSLPDMVSPGDKLLVEFGKAIFTVIRIEEYLLNSEVIKSPLPQIEIERFKRLKPKPQKSAKIVFCRVENDCFIDQKSPLNFLNASSFELNKCNNELEDIRLLEWASPMDIDIIIYKQIRDKEDLEDLWNFSIPNNTKRFVGIQTKETAENPDPYLDISEGCSIGRGILGVETSHSRVCSLQKRLIKLANAKGKPVIISTQVLDSMVVNDKPSRAEVVDAYCAVTDGVDGLTLTGETAYGKYPVLAVKALHKICIEAEQHINYKEQRENVYSTLTPPLHVLTGICYFAADAVEKINASLIICLTKTGKSAKMISKFKPPCIISAVTNSLKTLKFLRIVRGVCPILVSDIKDQDIEKIALQISIKNGLVKTGDTVIFVGNRLDSITEGATSSFRIIIASE